MSKTYIKPETADAIRDYIDASLAARQANLAESEARSVAGSLSVQEDILETVVITMNSKLYTFWFEDTPDGKRRPPCFAPVQEVIQC